MEKAFFNRVCRDRAWGNGFKLEKDRFTLDIKKKLFTLGVAMDWHGLSEKLWMPRHWKHSRSGWVEL